ncbi:hypothetical protein BDR03DRAFT_1009384 [Suillus americanus]|nr:hypothetical protein BDR03DRAFT_1009384 [Suillus americanus]
MAPPKWSTPEQGEWLGPWCDKYHAKQAEKIKKLVKLFAELCENWFISYPEPRPAGLPPLGPLTQDEVTIMKKAESDQKEALEIKNRFKNSLGTTKTGRQAKAEAADVFKAVLRSVVECEKPTHWRLSAGMRRILWEWRAYGAFHGKTVHDMWDANRHGCGSTWKHLDDRQCRALKRGKARKARAWECVTYCGNVAHLWHLLQESWRLSARKRLDDRRHRALKRRKAHKARAGTCHLVWESRRAYGTFCGKAAHHIQSHLDIMRLESLQHSLQEAEAYSKLYYQTRIKAMVDEALRAEAELLQVENKTLTNGKRVAIMMKQHTASLYSVETDKIKAEVQKYIENQKMEKGNEAKMWSQDDYARNLEKLAAIANKFLKGLAEATGFSFSLLAGGLSPESDLAVLNGSLGTLTSLDKFRSVDISADSASDYSELVRMGEADKSAPETSRVSSSLTQPDSVGQTFSGNTTGDNWNLDEDFWTTLAAQVADFNRSGCGPVLPESTSQFSSPTLQHVAPEVPLPLLHVLQSITPITSLHTALAPPLLPLLPGSQPSDAAAAPAWLSASKSDAPNSSCISAGEFDAPPPPVSQPASLMPPPPPISQPASLMPPPPPVSQPVSLMPPPPPISTPPVSPPSPPCTEPFAGGGGHLLADDGEPSDQCRTG